MNRKPVNNVLFRTFILIVLCICLYLFVKLSACCSIYFNISFFPAHFIILISSLLHFTDENYYSFEVRIPRKKSYADSFTLVRFNEGERKRKISSYNYWMRNQDGAIWFHIIQYYRASWSKMIKNDQEWSAIWIRKSQGSHNNLKPRSYKRARTIPRATAAYKDEKRKKKKMPQKQKIIIIK